MQLRQIERTSINCGFRKHGELLFDSIISNAARTLKVCRWRFVAPRRPKSAVWCAIFASLYVQQGPAAGLGAFDLRRTANRPAECGEVVFPFMAISGILDTSDQGSLACATECMSTHFAWR
jgi:hypothetical protein